MTRAAVFCALASAILFGLSAPLAKLLLGSIDPWLLAGLLYLGSGLGLAILHLAMAPRRNRAEAPLTRRDMPWLAAAVLSGGVIAPVLLMLGLAHTDGATASLLLTSEGAATALLAWFAFRENVDRRIAAGMLLIVAGAALLAWPGGGDLTRLSGAPLLVAACIAWGIDNNLTRKVAPADPLQVAMLKGLVPGSVNLALALARGAPLPAPPDPGAAPPVRLLRY